MTHIRSLTFVFSFRENKDMEAVPDKTDRLLTKLAIILPAINPSQLQGPI